MLRALGEKIGFIDLIEAFMNYFLPKIQHLTRWSHDSAFPHGASSLAEFKDFQ